MSVETSRGPTLRIVCVNDVYILEHLPRLLNLVRHHREHHPADKFLVTLAGDFVGPSMLSSLDKGRGMVDALNTVGVTHVIFGNHEDDIDVDELRERIREFHGVWLNSNVTDFVPTLPEHEVLTVAASDNTTRSVRVGLLGVVMEEPTVYRRKPFGGAPVAPANATALAVTKRLLSDEKCACVLPLTHQDVQADRELAQLQTEPPYPLIIGGHEHVAFLEQLGKTWLIKAGADATHAVIVDLSWPITALQNTADLPSVSVKIEAVADYPEDAALRARIDARMVAVHELETATLLRFPPGTVLTSVGTRMRQTSVGTLLCSRIRDALGSEGCLLNGGGIRGSRTYKDHFTYGDLKAELPFENEVTVVSLPGHVLREAIAASRAQSPAEAGGFLQVDDRMVVDDTGHVLTVVAGQPFDPSRIYHIAIMRNLMLGMDRIEPLVNYHNAHPECLPPEGSGRGIKVVLIDAFSRELWKQLGPFEAVDTDRDGKLSPGEIADAVSRVTSAPASKITVDFLIRAADKDANREISRDEIAAIWDGSEKK